ncbi:GNAT family N-acetyltransferase [Rossellomorea aquimaris]|uniref:GNAT family N-acetyltransferase n=1 Tax=Rossellomorea aquimaris TaxID=189382 RepID=UPI0021CCFC63|nr:GNAT family N-acetyltransferase [Rossellomorea aquimaris]
MATIKELQNRTEMIQAYPVMNELRTDLSKKTYLALVEEMRKEGYRLFALYEDDEIVSLAGIGERVNFYNKHHMYIYDFITSSNHRSKGYGKQLLEYVHRLADEIGVKYVALESGLERRDAHRFYEEKLGYEKWCFSFRKKLS